MSTSARQPAGKSSSPMTSRPAPNNRSAGYIFPTLLAIVVALGTMRYSHLLPAAVLPFIGVSSANNGGGDRLAPLTISAQGINATFIGYGARITSLFVDDKNGVARDLIVGYDDHSEYVRQAESSNAYVGSIVGRYANRIKNGTFTVDETEYKVTNNEHDGQNQLHGGFVGYDRESWTVSAHNTSSITFTWFDAAGTEGFPGSVINHVTYAVTGKTAKSRGKLTARVVSIALEDATPVMLSTHIYWNIGGFLAPNVLDNTLQLPNSNRIVAVDAINIPTGEILKASQTSLDFTSPKLVREGALSNPCGAGCIGIDNAFIFDNHTSSCLTQKTAKNPAQLLWSSPETGLTMHMRTNTPGTQIFSCATQDGSTVSHSWQGPTPGTAPKIEKYGCLVIEPQGWIDGINHPEWNQLDNQVFSATSGVAFNWAEYDFTV